MSAALILVSTMDAIELYVLTSLAFRALGASMPIWAIAAVCAAGFLFRATRLTWRSPSHSRCVRLFDRGLGILFAALFVAAVGRLGDPAPSLLAMPLVACGLVSLGLSRRGSSAGPCEVRVREEILRGSSGAVTSVFLALALAAIGALCLAPALLKPARGAAGLARGIFSSLEPGLGDFLGRMLSLRRRPLEAEAATVSGGPGAAALGSGGPGGWLHILAAVLVFGLAGLLALLAATLILARLFRRLAALLEGRKGLSRLGLALRRVMRSYVNFFARLESFCLRRAPHGAARSPSIAAYARMLACGRAAGLPRERTETPREYAGRLELALPRSARGAVMVVRAVEAEAYGGQKSPRELERELTDFRRRSIVPLFLAERVVRSISARARRPA